MFRKTKLKNGTTLLTVPVKGTKATTVLAMFPVGSRYEKLETSGASHFVEHMMFKGTEKRPAAIDISRELDAVGAHYNAFTSKEYTGYYIKIAANKQGLAMEVLADILFNSKFDPVEVEKEKGAIVEELRMYEDNPLMKIDQFFEQVMFGEHNLGWDIGGTEHTVRSITRDQLWEYYQRHYSPKSMTVIVAGHIDRRQLQNAKRLFGGRIASAGAAAFSFYERNLDRVPAQPHIVPIEKRILVKEKKLDQIQMIMGFQGFSYTDKERHAAHILSSILGEGMSSRLFVEVREKRGLVYMIRSEMGNYRDTGTFYIQAGVDPSRLPEAVKVIKEEIVKIAETGVTAKEVKDAQNHISGSLSLQLEDSYFQASWYGGRRLFFPTIETPEQYIRHLKKVTPDQVNKIARRLFNLDQLRVASIGPVGADKMAEFLH